MMPLNFLFPKPVIQNVISADTSHGWTLRDIAYSGQSCSELCQNRSEFSWKGTQTKPVFSAAMGPWIRSSQFCKQKHPWADLNVREPFIPTPSTKISSLNYKSLQVLQYLEISLLSIFTVLGLMPFCGQLFFKLDQGNDVSLLYICFKALVMQRGVEKWHAVAIAEVARNCSVEQSVVWQPSLCTYISAWPFSL